MVQLETLVKPGYDECCGCIDSQVLHKVRKDCKRCKKLKHATLHGFVRDKGKTYGIVSYDNGSFDAVELWMLIKKGNNDG